MVSQDVPKEMLAAQITEIKKPYTIHDIPTPQELGPHDMLVKVAVASLCHTDFMALEGIMGTSPPCTGSHEGSGTIVKVGSEVKKFKPGDRVMNGIFRNFCGVCPDCQGPENYQQYCSNPGGIIGITLHGNFAEYVIVDSRTSAKLPDKVSFETAAPLACAGTTVFRGVLQANLKKGEWLAIVGSGGGLGHLGIQFGKALGLNVIGIDARDEGLELSKKCGADVIVDVRKGNEEAVKQVHSVTNGKGADATVNVSDAKKAAATACAITKVHGTVIQIAQPTTVDIPFAELIFRDIRIQGSLISSPEESAQMLDLVAEHNISVNSNAFKGLKEIPKLFELAESGKMAGKGIVIVDEEQVKSERKDAV